MTVNQDVFSYVVNEERFPDKAFIIKEGGRGDWIYVILEGRVKLLKKTSKGMMTIDTLTEGDFVGEMSLLKRDSEPRIVSAVADGPVMVGSLDTTLLKQDWDAQPPRLKKLISSLIQNLEDSIKKAVSVVDERGSSP
jgi:CRP-like cAMP-binding protein